MRFSTSFSHPFHLGPFFFKAILGYYKHLSHWRSQVYPRQPFTGMELFIYFFNAWQRETDCDTLMLDDFSSSSLKPVLTSLTTRNLERPVPAVHEGKNRTSGSVNGSNFHTLLNRTVPLKVKLPDGQSNVTTTTPSSSSSSLILSVMNYAYRCCIVQMFNKATSTVRNAQRCRAEDGEPLSHGAASRRWGWRAVRHWELIKKKKNRKQSIFLRSSWGKAGDAYSLLLFCRFSSVCVWT